jgi:transposase-like protein
MDKKVTEQAEAKRRQHSGTEIMAVLKRHLVDKIPLSEVCKEFDVCPSQFYRWQKTWLEHGAEMFERKGPGAEKKQADAAQTRIAALEEKLKKKDSVMAELLEEHVALKKSLGEA